MSQPKSLTFKFNQLRLSLTNRLKAFKAVDPFPSWGALGIIKRDGGSVLIGQTSFNSLGEFLGVVNSLVTTIVPLTGATVLGNTSKKNETIYVNPAGTLAALTVSLPAVANSRVGETIRVFYSQVITSLTVNVSGSGTIVGTALTAATQYQSNTYQCVSISGAGTWIRLG